MKRLYNHYFPTPSYLSMNSFAVDISDESVKYGELIPTSQGLRLSKYGEEKIPNGVVSSGKIENENELIRILKRIKEKGKINFIRVSLPEEQMYLFTLSLPRTDNSNLRDMILLQIEEHIPLKAPDSLFDFDIVKEDGQTVLVEVVAIATATMESYLSVFNKAGLTPISFELEAQAIARAVIPVDDVSPIMIVDFGNSKTGISISNNGRVFLTTTLSMGGVDLTNMIAKNFSLSFEEAEKMKHEYGIDKGSKAEDIFPAILNGISVLRDEISKQCLYWETHNNTNNTEHNKISHIILCGGASNLAGLAEYLELSMKIKVENANVWVNILNTEDSIPEISFEQSLGYATVLGLALGGFNCSSPIVNVLPEKEKKSLCLKYWIRFSTVLLNLIALVVIISTVLLFPSYFLSLSKEKLAESELETFNKENVEFTTADIDKTINTINSKLSILDKGVPSYQVSDKVIDNILSNRTDGITFSQIFFNRQSTGSTLEIHGVATNRDALRNFKTKLDNNPNFTEVNLPISNFLEKTDLVFSVSIKMK